MGSRNPDMFLVCRSALNRRKWAAIPAVVYQRVKGAMIRRSSSEDSDALLTFLCLWCCQLSPHPPKRNGWRFEPERQGTVAASPCKRKNRLISPFISFIQFWSTHLRNTSIMNSAIPSSMNSRPKTRTDARRRLGERPVSRCFFSSFSHAADNLSPISFDSCTFSGLYRSAVSYSGLLPARNTGNIQLVGRENTAKINGDTIDACVDPHDMGLPKA